MANKEVKENKSEQDVIEIHNAVCVNPRWYKPYDTFAFVDCPQYLFVNIFRQHGIKPFFFSESAVKDGKYTHIMCSVWKKDVNKFLNCMYELTRIMLICGYTDYQDYCRDWSDKIGEEDD